MSQRDEAERDGAAVRFPPPLVPLVLIIVGVVVHHYVEPLAFDVDLALRIAGAALIFGVGAVVGASANVIFRKRGQDEKPWTTTPEIYTSGIYAITRNPMYLGMGLMQLGIGVALANGWVMAFVPLTWLIIYAIAIRHEEAYLATKFGETYLSYKRSVRRFI